MNHCAATPSFFARRSSYAIVGLLVAALAGCGGGADDAQPRSSVPPAEATSSVEATVFSGVAGDTVETTMQVGGTQGLARPGSLNSEGRYVAKLDQLTGPYLTIVATRDLDSGKQYLVSMTNRNGPLNITPLTQLAVAQVFGRDPVLVGRGIGLGGSPSLAVGTDAALLAAQPKVRRYLQQRFGFTVPDVGDFFYGAYSPVPGNPMYDAIVGLNARLAQANTNVYAVAADLAAETVLCNAERLVSTQGGVEGDFCPATKTAQIDADDTTVTNYSFTNRAGAALTVRVRGSDVLSATLQQPAAGPSFICSGAGCAGLTVGTPAGDSSRPIVFSNVQLTGTTGSVVLNGTLQAAKPGTFFPPLACDNRYYIALPDAPLALATCAAADSFTGTGVGEAGRVGAGPRIAYTFRSDGSVDPVPPSIDVRFDGDQVASVAVFDQDPDTGSDRVLFKCSGVACNGVTIGPARDDPDTFGPPYVLRQRLITLQDTVLSAVDSNGQPSATGSATVRATLDSLQLTTSPPEFLLSTPTPCASPTQRLVLTVSDEAQPIDACPPADPMGNDPTSFLSTSIDADGNLTFTIGSLFMGGDGNFSSGSRVTIRMSGASVAEVTYPAADFPSYRCRDAACAGITVSPPDGSGARAISFTGVVLGEVERGGLPGDRTTTINGGFTAPAPPP